MGKNETTASSPPHPHRTCNRDPFSICHLNKDFFVAIIFIKKIIKRS